MRSAMTTAMGASARRGLACMALLSILATGCTRGGDPMMGMIPPEPIGDGSPMMASVQAEPAALESAAMMAPAPVVVQMAPQVPTEPEVQREPRMEREPQGRMAAPAQQPAAPLETPPVRAAAAQSGPVQFLPVVGAPADKVALLSEALARNAAEKGVAILPSDAAIAPLRLKGYLSALGEGKETVVVYVWDVVDPTGNRVSRIQGQERVEGTATDPWNAVDGAALSAIAGRTIDEFVRGGPAAG